LAQPRHTKDSPPAQQKTLRGGVQPHQLTREERARGGRVKAERVKADKAALREAADERLHELLDVALCRLAGKLEAEDPDLRAIVEVLDRTMGKAPQRVEGELKPLHVTLSFDPRPDAT
jgi:hypothetical protein